ncbi:MAG: recombination protein RecR, partial [Gammaproteobacteria bacterium]
MALIDDLIQALQVLPGVGPKSAQRMALTLLQRNRSGGTQLGAILQQAMQDVRRCSVCQNLTESPMCRLCG